jgi:hypothetical protein
LGLISVVPLDESVRDVQQSTMCDLADAGEPVVIVHHWLQ